MWTPIETMGAIEYRDEAPEAAEFVRLFRTTGWDTADLLTVDGAAAALAAGWAAVCAYEGGRLVGTGRVVGDGVIHALLVDVIVAPERRGRGIGTTIVERLVARCREARVHDIELFCASGVAPFYERLGFRARPDGAPGMDLPQER